MKAGYLLIAILIVLTFQNTSAQNVGIGITNPIHGKLEVSQSVGNVVGLFGNGTNSGISLNYGFPEVGFNYYFNSANKAMAPGYASVIGMNPLNGDLYFGNFDGNQSAAPFSDINGYLDRMTLHQNGRFSIGVPSSSAQFSVARGTGTDGTAAFFGTTHVSHFNYGSFEDTYIRSGKDGRILYLNDIPNGFTVVGRTTTFGAVKLTIGDDFTSVYKGMNVTGTGGSLWPAIDAHGKNGSPAITLDGYVRVNSSSDSKFAYQVQVQTFDPNADGFLSDSYTPGPGSPDGTVTIRLNNPLINNDPDALIYYSFVGYYQNNKNYQSYLSYNAVLGRWWIVYKYDVYPGFISNNQAPKINIMIVKQ